jgi:VCBS repeat-containing protein
LGGGGGGGGGGTAGPVAPNGGVKPDVLITTDKNNDGYLNSEDIKAAPTTNLIKYLAVTATFVKANVAVGDQVIFTDNGGHTTTVTLTQAMFDAIPSSEPNMTVTADLATFPAPIKQGDIFKVEALLQRGTLKTAAGTDEVILDTVAPNTDPKTPADVVAPTVLISNDIKAVLGDGGDAVVNSTELQNGNGKFQVTTTFNSANVVLGDKVTFNATEINGKDSKDRASITRALTEAEIKAGSATESFEPPLEGSALQVTALLEDVHGNKSPLSNTDTATLLAKLPTVTSGLSGVSDIGKLNAPMTADATPILAVATTSKVTKIILENITPGGSGGFIDIPLSNLDSNGNVQIPDNLKLPVGLYRPSITVVDSVNNQQTVPGTSFTVTQLVGVKDDQLSVQEGGMVLGVVTSQTAITADNLAANVLTNDYDAYTKLTGKATAPGNLTVAAITYSDGGVDKAVELGKSFITKYGVFKIAADGKYTYSLNDTTAQELVTMPSGVTAATESFKYTVQDASDGLSVSDVNLKIGIYGADDPAVISFKNGSSAGANNLVKSWATHGSNGGKDIQITDLDLAQNFLNYLGGAQPVSMTVVGSPYTFSDGLGGTFKLTLQAPTQGQIDAHLQSYLWAYGYNETGYGSLSKATVAGVTYHDLLTVSSKDGSVTQTLEALVGDPNGAEASDKQHEFYTPTTARLTVAGHLDSTYADKLFITRDGLTLDLTATTTNVSNMDSFDITGTAAQPGATANTIKLDINALTQAAAVGQDNHHALYIIGDNGDKVVIVGAIGTVWTKSQDSSNGQQDWIYTHVGTNDQLVIDAHITASNISFVAT